MGIQVIDLARIDTPAKLAAAVQDAAKTLGFVALINHGMEEAAREQFEISEELFTKETVEEKTRCAYLNNLGYTKVAQEQLDPSQAAPDLKEGFNIASLPLDSSASALHPLPPTLASRRAKISAFQDACHAFSQRLLEAFAIALKLDDADFFTKQHVREGTSILRYLHYVPVPAGEQADPNRAGAHSDYGSLTLLWARAEGGEGLEILPSTEPIDSPNWVPVSVPGSAVLVNIGDALELWSGATFKSTVHRVRLPSPTPAEGVPERYSIAWFNQPAPDAVLQSVVPVEEISALDLERMERKGVKPGKAVTSAEHLAARLAATYKQRS